MKKTVFCSKLPQGTSPYTSPCPLIHALHIIGGKWKLPILWHLADQKPVRYNELRRSVTGITNMMLTKCLRELEEEGLVQRKQFQEIPPHVEYSLTTRGNQLIPALKSLYKWGEEHLLLKSQQETE